MADLLSPEARSGNMRRIQSKGTSPELYVRRLLHSQGYRYRLHVRDLPGKPDLVFPKLKRVIFVHGCFWHLHSGCREGRIPGSRREYWEPKLLKNVERDAEHVAALRVLGWGAFVVWECELMDPEGIRERLIEFLDA
jgi:DNA mismatch endonuclease (patch repair protein)